MSLQAESRGGSAAVIFLNEDHPRICVRKINPYFDVSSNISTLIAVSEYKKHFLNVIWRLLNHKSLEAT
jgi:hypothetical protein